MRIILFALILLSTICKAQSRTGIHQAKADQALTASSILKTKTFEGQKSLINTSGEQESFQDFIHQICVNQLGLILQDYDMHVIQFSNDEGQILKVEVRASLKGTSKDQKNLFEAQNLVTYYYTKEGNLYFLDIVSYSISGGEVDEDRGLIYYDQTNAAVLREVFNGNKKELSDERKKQLMAYHKGAKTFRSLK